MGSTRWCLQLLGSVAKSLQEQEPAWLGKEQAVPQNANAEAKWLKHSVARTGNLLPWLSNGEKLKPCIYDKVTCRTTVPNINETCTKTGNLFGAIHQGFSDQCVEEHRSKQWQQYASRVLLAWIRFDVKYSIDDAEAQTMWTNIELCRPTLVIPSFE